MPKLVWERHTRALVSKDLRFAIDGEPGKYELHDLVADKTRAFQTEADAKQYAEEILSAD